MTIGSYSPDEIIHNMRSMLVREGVDPDSEIASLGQIQLVKARRDGRLFTLRDHVRGLVLAQLSANREWKGIAENLTPLERVFFGYEPDLLEQADTDLIIKEVTNLRCGNRSIAKQVGALPLNIAKFRAIKQNFGSVDHFITKDRPMEVIKKLSKHGGEFKLTQLGRPLAAEYLKNVGVDVAKPDVHVSRIIGPRRLAIASDETEGVVIEAIEQMAEQAKTSATYIDNLLWLFCATKYGEICGVDPKCVRCTLRASCNTGRISGSMALSD